MRWIETQPKQPSSHHKTHTLGFSCSEASVWVFDWWTYCWVFAKEIRTFHLIILDDLENIIRTSFYMFNTISCVWLWRYKSRLTSFHSPPLSLFLYVCVLVRETSFCNFLSVFFCTSLLLLCTELGSKWLTVYLSLDLSLSFWFFFLSSLHSSFVCCCCCFCLFEIIKSLRVCWSDNNSSLPKNRRKRTRKMKKKTYNWKHVP